MQTRRQSVMKRSSSKPPSYKVGYAESSEFPTTCKLCKVTIPQNDLRLATMVETPMTSLTGYRAPDWHHFGCFFVQQRPNSEADFACFDQLRADDQDRIRKQVELIKASYSAPGRNSFANFLSNGGAYSLRSSTSTTTNRAAPTSTSPAYSSYSPALSTSNSTFSTSLSNTNSSHVPATALNMTTPSDHSYTATLPTSTSSIPQDLLDDVLDATMDPHNSPVAPKRVRKTPTVVYVGKPYTTVASSSAHLGTSSSTKPSTNNTSGAVYSSFGASGLPNLGTPSSNGVLHSTPVVSSSPQFFSSPSSTNVSTSGVVNNVPATPGQYFTLPSTHTVAISSPFPQSAVNTPNLLPVITKYASSTKTMYSAPMSPVAPNQFPLNSPLTKHQRRCRTVVTTVRDHLSLLRGQRLQDPARLTQEQQLKMLQKTNINPQPVKMVVPTLTSTPSSLTPLQLLTSVPQVSTSNSAATNPVRFYPTAPHLIAGLPFHRVAAIANTPLTHYSSPVVRKRSKKSQEYSPSTITSSNCSYFPEPSTFTYRPNDVTSTSIGLQVKNNVAVDPQSLYVYSTHVYQNPEGNAYNAVLLRTDWESETNSFHKLQILERQQPRQEYWFFQSKGEIGTDGYLYDETSMNIENALVKFEQIFYEQTGNLWSNRHQFERLPGKKLLLDIVYKPNVIVNEEKAPSRLVGPVQKFVRLIHQFGNTSREVESLGIQTLDLKVWPLGKVSDRQIQEAYGVLMSLEDYVAKPVAERTEDDLRKIIRFTNLYYMLIPRSFGSGKPPLLSTSEAVQNETEKLDSCMKTETQYSLIDAYYGTLNAELRPLGPEEVMYEVVKTGLLNTCPNRQLVVVEIFKVERVGEDERYTPYKTLENRRLLWHGSKLINFSRILAKGLCIAPAGAAISGHSFGRGIYFSDMVAKAANYCDAKPSTQNTGLLLLCEVALGKMQCVTSVQSHVTKPMTGYDSVKAVGTTCPDPQMNMVLEDGVEIAIGTAVASHPSSGTFSLPYNEYVVFNEAQVKIRYLVQVTF